jgi:hypothetical protein
MMKKYFYVYQSNYKKQEISRNRRSLFEPSIWQKALLVLSFRENKKTLIARQKRFVGLRAEHCIFLKLQCSALTSLSMLFDYC